jgi:hypothetical protein
VPCRLRQPASDQQRNHEFSDQNRPKAVAAIRRPPDADERVDNVPDAINHPNLVGDKLDYEKTAQPITTSS